jgi:protein phosphatase
LYSLGSERSPKIDLFEQTLQTGDILFLCSDGLTRHVTDPEIALILGEEAPEQATTTLIRKANERGGEDNISVAIIRFDGKTAADPQKPVEHHTRPLVVAKQAQGETVTANRSLLWLYTIALGLVQSVLIFLVWLLLRV